MIKYIDEVELRNKRILLRLECNVSLRSDFTIADDARIRQSLPTLQYLLDGQNKLIIATHLGRPQGRDPHLSLRVVADKLQSFLPQYKVTLVEDFLVADETVFRNQQPNEILVLENLRFYPGEKSNDPSFASSLAHLADIYVNDAFGNSHRQDASIVGVPAHIPSYGGLLLKKEISQIDKAIQNPQKPFVAIIGGAKIETKLPLLNKLMILADHLLVGGIIANALLDPKNKKMKEDLLQIAKTHNTELVLPIDGLVADQKDANEYHVEELKHVTGYNNIFDIGPQTRALYTAIVKDARTLVWNGPMGYIENPIFSKGTQAIYEAITNNTYVHSVVGGGETLAAISKEEYLDKITHLSTGGGAMLVYIEKGTLPGIEVLKSRE